VTHGGPLGGSRARWEADEQVVAAVLQAGGELAAARDMLEQTGVAVPAQSTFDRAVRRRLGVQGIAEARRGIEGRRRYELFLQREVGDRNESWAADWKDLHIPVRDQAGNLLRRSGDGSVEEGEAQGELLHWWAFIVEDEAARAIVAARLAVHPNAEIVRAVLFEAFCGLGDDPRFGGIPGRIVWDNDTMFTAESVSPLLEAVGLERQRQGAGTLDSGQIDAYAPHQNGRVERLNRLVEGRFSRATPGYLRGPRKRNGEPQSPAELAPLPDELERSWAAFVHWANYERKVRPLGRKAPSAAWDAGTARLVWADPSALRDVLEREARVVSKSGVSLPGRGPLA
jgi:transposase InsO family protein